MPGFQRSLSFPNINITISGFKNSIALLPSTMMPSRWDNLFRARGRISASSCWRRFYPYNLLSACLEKSSGIFVLSGECLLIVNKRSVELCFCIFNCSPFPGCTADFRPLSMRWERCCSSRTAVIVLPALLHVPPIPIIKGLFMNFRAIRMIRIIVGVSPAKERQR